jgi:SAM-dependent methyltransferase
MNRRSLLVATPALRRVHLLGPAFRAYEWLLSLHLEREPKTAPDGLPVPPRHMRTLVYGPNREGFLRGGEQNAKNIASVIAATGLNLDDATVILDFGCGCGRITRFWRPLLTREVHACDYNPRLVAWCSKNLRHVQTQQNGLDPPLPYPDAKFDVIYSISVFTHLDEARQHSWMAELVRVLAPGGRLLFTVHGEAARPHMTVRELTDFDAGRPVARFDEHSGSNLCSTYHPRSWVEGHLLKDLELLSYISAGEIFPVHDTYIAAKASRCSLG